MSKKLGILYVTAALIVGCNSEPQQPQAQPVQPGQVAVQPGQVPVGPGQVAVGPGQVPAAAPTPATVPAVPGGANNPLAGMAQAMGAMAGQAGAPVAGGTVVQWQSIQQALPLAAPGWAVKGQPKGETVSAMGISVSQASVDLTQGAMTAHVQIVDTSANPALAMPFNMARAIRIDSSTERQGPINFGTNPGFQKFDKSNNSAEVLVLVANRFLVEIDVKNCASEQIASSLAAYINYNHLAALVAPK